MNTKSRGFKAVDILLLVLTVLPMVCAMVIKVLTKPYSEGMNIAGAQIFFTLPMPVQDLPITEAQINSWLLIISVLFLCLYLTHGLSVKHPTNPYIHQIPFLHLYLGIELLIIFVLHLLIQNYH